MVSHLCSRVVLEEQLRREACRLVGVEKVVAKVKERTIDGGQQPTTRDMSAIAMAAMVDDGVDAMHGRFG